MSEKPWTVRCDTEHPIGTWDNFKDAYALVMAARGYGRPLRPKCSRSGNGNGNLTLETGAMDSIMHGARSKVAVAEGLPAWACLASGLPH